MFVEDPLGLTRERAFRSSHDVIACGIGAVFDLPARPSEQAFAARIWRSDEVYAGTNAQSDVLYCSYQSPYTHKGWRCGSRSRRVIVRSSDSSLDRWSMVLSCLGPQCGPWHIPVPLGKQTAWNLQSDAICVTCCSEGEQGDGVLHGLEAVLPLLAVVCFKVEDVGVFAPSRVSNSFSLLGWTCIYICSGRHPRTHAPGAAWPAERLEVPIDQTHKVGVHRALCL